ncbi:Cytochrome P450 [Glarea lozoyensis ATCC 20868]|uniref:Cytochrome P450 n=1 Tax=Glarea lozoyensis (strain ATCC 20868 / MF5171) TaxID=1116229 RepID=S3CE48_GLAL2|nr:Cytochrome P450 [Glarea lozoyensis ATCC 20868]EPE24762.1 Cytochrome P450 [Glarea lozoyensis ATCC 20868]
MQFVHEINLKSTIEVTLLAVAFVSSVTLLTWLVTDIKYRVAANRAGCSIPKRYFHWDPFLGLDLFFLRISDMKAGDSIATDTNLIKRYGKTVQTNSWGTKQYVISDPINIQTILTTQVDNFGSAPMNRKMCADFLGDGVMTVDGHAWKQSRQMINPVFARAQVSELSSFEKHLAQMIDQIPKSGGTIDMQPLCKRLFLDSSSEFVFGKSANSLSPETDSPIARRLPGLFDEALVGMFTRFMMGKFSFMAGSKRKYLEQCKAVHDIIDGFIDEEIELQKEMKENGKTNAKNGTPYSYVLLKELAKETEDRRVIRNELMNVFFPARDTAAILLSNVLFLLARHPEKWEKLRSEVLGIKDKKLTFELLKSLKYMQAVMNETLRLHSPAGGSWKTCLAPSILPHGGGKSGKEPILLQTGDQVRMSFAPLHVDPEIWGEDANEFKPERWQNLKQSWNFIPFMGGRRICPAQQNVLTDVACIMVRLMQKYKALENRDECYEYVDRIVFTRESKHGAKVGFIPA